MLYLHGVGHFHPKTVIDNPFLCELDIGIESNWIEDRVGIRERRTSLSLDYIRDTKNADTRAAREGATTTTQEMARSAAEMALRRANIERDAIKWVIGGGCCPEMMIPAEASRVAAAIGIDAVSMDVSAACASFVAQLFFLDKMRPESLPDFVLVVNVEAFTRSIDYSDRATAVLFGDGATAAIVSSRVPSRSRILRSDFGTDPSGQGLITIPAGGHFSQRGNSVQIFAVRRTCDLFEKMRLPPGEGDPCREFFIGHQANLRMLESVCRRAHVPAGQHLSNVRDFGNCGAAGAPSVLSQHWDSFESEVVNIAVVGSGLSWGGLKICMGSPTEN